MNGLSPGIGAELTRIREQRDALWTVLNAVRVAVKFKSTTLQQDLTELLPRMNEVLKTD